MPTYNQNILAGQTRRRVWRINGENLNALEVPGAVPTMTFFEQEVVRLGDGTEAPLRRERDITVTFTPGKVVPLRDMATDALLPGQTTTHDAIRLALHALARQAQEEQDLAEAAANGD